MPYELNLLNHLHVFLRHSMFHSSLKTLRSSLLLQRVKTSSLATHTSFIGDTCPMKPIGDWAVYQAVSAKCFHFPPSGCLTFPVANHVPFWNGCLGAGEGWGGSQWLL